MSDDLPELIETDGNPVPGNHVVGWFKSAGGKAYPLRDFQIRGIGGARHGRFAAGSK